MIKIDGGVTAAKGFKAAGMAAGIKKNGALDMAMITCEKPCTMAGTFTTNRVKAAPVIWDRAFVNEKRPAQAIVINSGVANACTGEEGMRYCGETCEAAGEALSLDKNLVLVASTGVIGQQLPISKIKEGAKALAGLVAPDLMHGSEAARAIMTTDTVSKEIAVKMTLTDGTEAVLGGCTKGSGMIHPNMCTMLCFLTTDAAISRDCLQSALSSVIPDTFNMLSVDGDTSTNDTCVVLASGLAGNEEIASEGDDYQIFLDALKYVCEQLARKMARDGEGATCLFQCDVINAASKEQAKILARSVVSSTLTKAAIAGHDANWGRILCALGYAGVEFDPDKTDLYIESSAGRMKLFEQGTPLTVDEEKATEILSQDEIHAVADLNEGEACAQAWGCDLTHEYVNINADYRS